MFVRRLRSSQARAALGLVLLALIVLALVTQRRNMWQPEKLLGMALLNPDWEQTTELVQRVSLNRIGIEGNSDSFAPSISSDGRLVVFVSSADNLTPGDTNGLQDVFIYDRASEEVRRITVGYDGSEPNGPSSDAHISGDGRLITFVSEASNLVESDNNGYADVFLYDLETRQVQMVSVSPDGRQGDERSVQPSITADGRFVSFVSLAENLHEDDSNGVSDIFVWDQQEGLLELVSVDNEGRQANDHSKYATISADGRYVVYQSRASNLASGDLNKTYDIFLRDRLEGVTELISRNGEGAVGNRESQRPTISADGRFVAFESWADDLVSGDVNFYSDVVVLDRRTGQAELASVDSQGRQANHVSGGAVISDDGRYVAFSSMAGNLAPNDNNQVFDVFLRDRREGTTRLVSVNVNGRAGNGVSISPALTSGAKYIVFDSGATDLVPNDSNGRIDVFVFNSPMADDTPASYMVHLPVTVAR